MSTYTPPVHAHHRMHIDVRLGVIVGLLAALVALGSWVLVDRYTGGGATQDARTLIDKWQTASTAHDSQAITALLTSDAVQWFNGSTITGPKAIVNGIMTTPGLQVERTAPVTVEGNFASTFATFKAPPVAANTLPMVEIYQFKNGKIFRLWSFVLGTTAPLNNTAAP